jgi:hypothetical protein
MVIFPGPVVVTVCYAVIALPTRIPRINQVGLFASQCRLRPTRMSYLLSATLKTWITTLLTLPEKEILIVLYVR